MKIGKSLLGCMISLFVSETKGEDGSCVMSNPEYYECYKYPEVGSLSVIPGNLSAMAKGIKLHGDDEDESWLINSINYFSVYPALLEISIFGPVKIDESLLNPSTKVELQNRLFDLPKLKLIECSNCLFDSYSHMWKLPGSIERLLLQNNLYESFQVSYSPYLIELDLENNSLTKMPEWYEDKPSPVQTLRLLNNPRLAISFVDVAKLCDLNVITLNVSNKFITNASQACDCYRIAEWMKEFEIEILSSDGNALKCYEIFQCDENKMEEYRVKQEICREKRHRKKPTDHKPPLKRSRELLTTVFVIIFVLLCILATGIMVYARIADRKLRRSIKSKKSDQPIPDEIGAYF